MDDDESHSIESFRHYLMLSAIPTISSFFISTCYNVESPRYLLTKNYTQECFDLLKQLR